MRHLLLASVLFVSTLIPGNASTTSPLKAGDVVSVNVFDEPSLTGVFKIGTDGAMVFPLLGALETEGKSAAELAGLIEQLLEASYIRDAQVSVALSEESVLPPNSVTVIGQVTSPGKVPFAAETSIDVFTAIASAGGLSERADRNHIELKRRSGNDLSSRIIGLERDRVLQLQDGDTLVVGTKEEEKVSMITVMGEVKTPGTIEMNPQYPMDLITAIASAGGFTDKARPSKVIVRRAGESGVQSFELNVSKMQKDDGQPFFLLPDDIVSVPESIF